MILAALAEGHADLADVCFLIGVVLAVVAGILYLVSVPAPPRNIASAFLAFAVGAIAVGFLVL